MNKSLMDLLIGTILGDASLRKSSNMASIYFEQSIKHSEYLHYIYSSIRETEHLSELLTPIVTTNRYDKRHNSHTSSLRFSIKSNFMLVPLADKFLDATRNKIIPLDFASFLTPRVLAFWIMDDGYHYKTGGLTLCTDSFKIYEIEILRESLNSVFNLKTTIHTKTGRNGAKYYRIYIPKQGIDKIKPFLVPHFTSSMMYKLNL